MVIFENMEENSIEKTNVIHDANQSRRIEFFGRFIHHVKTDHLMIEKGVASQETKEFYDTMSSGNIDSILQKTMEDVNHFYYRNIINTFLDLTDSFKESIKNVSFDISGTKILVWAVIKDQSDYDDVEHKLIMSEAKVNAEFYDKGYHMDVTFVEEEDNIPTPPHYFQY